MKIVDIRQKTVAIGTAMRNADIAYDTMTASAVVVVSDVHRNGKPLIGLGFDSIGRYAHGGLLAERFAPRLLAADPQDYEDGDGGIDPERAWSLVMANEKPGGHGERAGAVGLLDAALWDLAAKAAAVPLWRLLADHYGTEPSSTIAVYGSGGHYTEDGSLDPLVAELRGYRELGYTRLKIKIGGAPLDDDLRRIDAALDIVGEGANLAVDGNGTFPPDKADAYFEALGDRRLAWIEEPVDPLDYDLNAAMAARHALPIGTGENVFSAADTRNLLRHAGLRPNKDLLQMDLALSYGIPEYRRILDLAAADGWARDRFWPHAGHFLAFHAVAGLGLGGHEAAPDTGKIFGGLPAGVVLADGRSTLPEMPGVGIEGKDDLYGLFADLLD